MKTSMLGLLFLVAGGCGGSTGETDPKVQGDQNDLTKKARVFECSGGLEFNNLTLRGSGNAITLSTTTDIGTYTAKFDPSYPGPRTKPNNLDFRRFTWVQDPWQDGWSAIFVHKDMLEGKPGTMKFQATGESFLNDYYACKPNPE
jgi:hypothetical protein